MAKAHKKKRVMKKAVRRTIGSLFLASAIVVAAIPVDGLQAAPVRSAALVEVTKDNTTIPMAVANQQIYTTKIPDSPYQFQFAYIAPRSGGDNVAMILGWSGSVPSNKTMVIPKSMDAYKKYYLNDGDMNNGFVAVSKSDEFLYYAVEETSTDVSGNSIVTGVSYVPCFFENKDRWEDLKPDEFYYKSSESPEKYSLTTEAAHQWITSAMVEYIGNQYLDTQYTSEGQANGTWKVGSVTTDGVPGLITDGSKGIFANNSNLSRVLLEDGSQLKGIGNYAFYYCNNLSSIDLPMSVNNIGNYAFALCGNMTSAKLDPSANVQIIGAHAFENCTRLESFSMPTGVKKVGDCAFAGCTSLTNVDFILKDPITGGNMTSSLNELGEGIFANCANLTGIKFPDTFANQGDTGNQPIRAINLADMFEGCARLAYISSGNEYLEFDDSHGVGGTDTDGYETFKNTVPESFYFEATDGSKIHAMVTGVLGDERAARQEFAFSYLDPYTKEKMDRYEIIRYEGTGAKKAIFTADGAGNLEHCTMDEGLTTVRFPEAVGPVAITGIDGETFRDNCFLTDLTIPYSIKYIAAGAFEGCHSLKNVTFGVDADGEPNRAMRIDPGAFRTQIADMTHHVNCPSSGALSSTPSLNFAGVVSAGYAPFEYAMLPSNKINTSEQPDTYITYYSGWPSNLVVRYNAATDKNELIEYPTLYDIEHSEYQDTDKYFYMTDAYKAAATASAVTRYFTDNPDPALTPNEKAVVDAAMNLVLPDGIESIKQNLFVNNATKEDSDGARLAGRAKKKTITAQSLEEVAAGSFKDFTNLSEIDLGKTKTIGDYAFEGCTSLYHVSVPDTVTALGKAPFLNCDDLENVSFDGSNFICDNSIIYSLDASGSKAGIIEYLKGRDSGVVDRAETAGVKYVAPDAFKDTKVSSVDMSNSQIDAVPTLAFGETPDLYSVLLPSTCNSIEKDAFYNSAIKFLEIPESVTYIDPASFSGANTTAPAAITVKCVPGGIVERTVKNMGMKTQQKAPEYIVRFWDWDNTLLDTQTVEGGKDAVPPQVSREGYRLTGWIEDYRAVNKNKDCKAQYEEIVLTHTVSFLDADSKIIKVLDIPDGGDVRTVDLPEPPVKAGYKFIGWSSPLTNIIEDIVASPVFEDENAEYTVTFRIKTDDGEKIHAVQTVKSGEDAIVPQDPVLEGQTFKGWWPEVTNVRADIDTYAQFVPNGSIESTRFTVLFLDFDEKTISSQLVYSGESAVIPQSPTRAGYTFTGWLPSDVSNVTENMKVYAQYEKNTGSGAEGGSGTGNGTGSNANNVKLYTLTVRGGSGSGSYVEGSQPIVIAGDPAAGQEFSHWTIDPADTKIASKVLTATVITMPAQDVTVTANYKAKTGTSTGNGTANEGAANRPGTTGVVSSGTTVVIDKNGLSNTGVVSATVRGSSDNFTIKVTENAASSEAVLRALQAEFGTLDDIKYFPMDISLYDSTGTKKITDTTGLSISITLPLPDSLIEYAGNNKVAGVVNDRLDKLSAKFTTIDKVPCITFTAEHFSPYVIYVQTNRLEAGASIDSTPKTGDGIHPKWFLSIGLACVSAVFFMKKDKRSLQKVRAA